MEWKEELAWVSSALYCCAVRRRNNNISSSSSILLRRIGWCIHVLKNEIYLRTCPQKARRTGQKSICLFSYLGKRCRWLLRNCVLFVSVLSELKMAPNRHKHKPFGCVCVGRHKPYSCFQNVPNRITSSVPHDLCMCLYNWCIIHAVLNTCLIQLFYLNYTICMIEMVIRVKGFRY